MYILILTATCSPPTSGKKLVSVADKDVTETWNCAKCREQLITRLTHLEPKPIPKAGETGQKY